MKIAHLSIFLFAISNISFSQSLQWVKSIGGTSNDVGTSIVVDKNENIFTAGYFSETVDFDPSSAVFNLTSVGGNDIFFTKMDINGNFVWAKQIGGENDEFIDNGFLGEEGSLPTISIDALGNIYSTGYFTGTADLDPSSSVSNFISSGNDDAFVIKMDNDGALLWGKSFGSSEKDRSRSIAISNDGSVILTGYFEGTVDFDSSENVDIKTSNGMADIFITKLSANGVYFWTRTFGNLNMDSGVAVTTDNSNNIILVGNYSNSINFNPSVPDDELSSMSNSAPFLLKLNDIGNYIYSKKVDDSYGFGESLRTGKCIKVDQNKNIYVAINFINLDAISGSTILKYDSNGINNFQDNIEVNGCLDQMRGVGNFVYDFIIPSNIYVAFKPFLEISHEHLNEESEELPIIINKIDINEQATRISPYVNSLNFEVNDIFVDYTGNIYSIGSFSGNVNFNSSPSIGAKIGEPLYEAITSQGGTDIFIQKFINEPLPIILSSFSAKNWGNTNHLEWQTASEINSNLFEVERSGDAKKFEKIGLIKAKVNSNEKTSYNFIDINPISGVNYYRLKLYDFDGKNTFSKIISVKYIKNEVIISPNPSKGILTVIHKENLCNYSIVISDLNGKELLRKENLNSLVEQIDINHFSDGVFFIQIHSSEMIKNYKIILAK
ncbi:MAG: T9SS type A sorting domain-containing protein [Bacteroidota bacterium]